MTRILSTTILIGLLAGALSAQTLTYTLELTGAEEVPAVPVAGIGTATVTLNQSTGAVSVSGTYSGMTSAVIAAHIHGSQRRGMNAGVLVNLTHSGGTSGTFSGSGTLNAAQVQSMLDGLMYLNVHTGTNPGGEIRAQVDSVPGAGSPSAPPIHVSGSATPGGSLTIGCPPSINQPFILLGLALGPGASVPLPAVLVCAPGPANLALDLSIPIGVVNGGASTIPVPATLPQIHVGFQCLFVSLNPCLSLSGAARVAIR
jgi:hypothetical protein